MATDLAARTQHPSAASADRRWLVLGVIAAAQLMTALDATIVNIALPSVQRALGFSDGSRQWVVTAYTCCFAGLLLLGGRIADVLGRRRAFQVGLIGFALASLLAGVAPDLGVLIAGRALQGAFAAVIAPTALSLLAVTFAEPAERAKAFGLFGAVVSSGAALGLLTGGVLTQYLDWRWCLFVNVVVAAVVVPIGRVVLPDPPRHPAGRIDIVSAVLATGGLATIVLACSQAATRGWSSAVVVGALGAGAAALVGFAARQRSATAPMLPLPIVRDRNRAAACLAAATAVVGSFGMFLLLTYYLQVVLGYSPVRAGLAVVPLTVANSVSGYQLGSRLLPRVAPRVLIAGGLLIAAAGLAVLAQLDPDSGYASTVLPAELLVGIGMGSLFPPVFAVAMRGIEQRDSGVASAVINASTQVGSSIGTAVLNTLAVSATAAYAAAHAAGADVRVPALVHGYAVATGWSAAILAAVGVALAVVINAPRPKEGT